MRNQSRVLVSWIAVNNDPFERERPGGGHRLVGGEPVPGPTLTVLLDEMSPFAGEIGEAVLLHRKTRGAEDERERRAVEETSRVLRERLPDLQLHLEAWSGDDPTDHRAIFEFLREAVPRLRKRFSGRELVIHISPGTPSMQTLWVLMGETGFVDPPFTLVKSYRRTDRHEGPAVVPVTLGIETFYKVYKAARPRRIASEEQGVVWDPGRFRTERMRRLFTEARRFAGLDVPVLLLGERGTGKTTIASWIRLHSPFRQEARDSGWPTVACGQYNPDTMRAELFGYQKGAFTDATTDKEGLLSAADGDTLFLDEVGDVSRDLQRLLIKAIEEKEYVPLGGDRPRRSDFRLLAATNVDNAELRRRLDPDFFDRISLLTLRLPPLREVRDELPWLWEATYQEAARRAGVDEHSRANRRRPASPDRRGARTPSVAREPPRPLPDRVPAPGRAKRSPRADSPRRTPPPTHSKVWTNIRQGRPETGGACRRPWPGPSLNPVPLDDVLDTAGRIPTKAIEHDLKAFLGNEIRRFAKARGVAIDELCDVSERTLRTWKQDH